jgi:hypothetical protein
MYILREYVACVILVAGVVAALLAVGWACVALVQILYRAALQVGRLLPRSSLAAARWGIPLFKNGDNLVAVKVSDREERGGLVLLDRSGARMPRARW